MAQDPLHNVITLHHDKVLIVDFGSQVTQLIARRVREACVYCEIAPVQNAEKAFAELAQDSSDFALWFRERVKDVSGVDLAEPPEGGPELVLDWNG